MFNEFVTQSLSYYERHNDSMIDYLASYVFLVALRARFVMERQNCGYLVNHSRKYRFSKGLSIRFS